MEDGLQDSVLDRATTTSRALEARYCRRSRELLLCVYVYILKSSKLRLGIRCPSATLSTTHPSTPKKYLLPGAAVIGGVKRSRKEAEREREREKRKRASELRTYFLWSCCAYRHIEVRAALVFGRQSTKVAGSKIRNPPLPRTVMGKHVT